LEYPGALWHVTSRGNERSPIFRDDDDRRLFLTVLADVVRLRAWRIHAYVLMGNHYHLLLETPEANLSRGMHRLNAVYSQKFNVRHERVGHLMQGRFKAILVEKERHLLELVRYVVLNPVRAGLVREAAEWPWSNYRATAALESPPPWLDTGWTAAQFGSGADATAGYAEFVRAGASSVAAPWRRVTDQLFLGSDEFRRRHRRQMERDAPASKAIPRSQTSLLRPTLAEVIAAAASVLGVRSRELRRPRRTPLRLVVAYIARQDCLVPVPRIAAVLGVSRSAASEIASAARRLRIHDSAFRAKLALVRAEIRATTRSRTPTNRDLTPETPTTRSRTPTNRDLTPETPPK
jgi:REP element-mobilizing transposase RayT